MEIFEFAKTNVPNTQSTEVVQKEKKKHEYKLIGRARRIPGLTMFSVNLITGEIKEAPVEKCKILDFKTQKPIQNAKISIEKDCIYRQALNKRSLIKCLKREGITIKEIPEEK